ncbi:7908_t:CDS:10, partial [Entrophospora sp. SA101]
EDSPKFRKELIDCENSVFGLENSIKNLVKLAKSSVDLASELGSFAKQQPESTIKSILIKYATSLQEVERSRRILNSHINEMFIEPLDPQCPATEDSPKFRKELIDCENSVFGLENSIKNLVKLAKSSVDLASELGSFAKQQPESTIKSILIKYATSLQEVERSRRILNSHINEMFIEPLEAFAKNEILPLKEVKKVFEKASNEADTAIAKYMNKKPKDSTISEASFEVSETRREFHFRYLDYVTRLNELEAKKKFEFMEYILALMFTESSFYHQSYETMKDLEPHMKDVTRLLHETRMKYNNDMRDSDQIKKSILDLAKETYNPLSSKKKPMGKLQKTTLNKSSSSLNKSGYLFMKGNQRVIQSWSRKYFVISGEYLYHSSRNGKVSKEEEEPYSINLRVCHIKPVQNIDRRFCFEIISPMKTYVLQAENLEDMEDWMYCLQTAAKEALYSDRIPKSTYGDELFNYDMIGDFNIKSKHIKEEEEEELQRIHNSINKIKGFPGNSICADCKIKGIHRSLGVHVSKVRSLMLDKWEPESIEVMLRLGNSKTNEIFEAKLNDDCYKNANSSSWERAEREKFILEKYVKKIFIVKKDDDSLDINLEFWIAMNKTNLHEALRYLSLGANIDWKNDEENSTTALHQAILRNDDVAVEFLLLWLCDINSVPVDIAAELQNVEAVTALRLYQFETELTRSEYSSFGVDEALTSVSKPYNRSVSSSLDLRINTNNGNNKNKNSTTNSLPTTPPSLKPLIDISELNKDINKSRNSVDVINDPSDLADLVASKLVTTVSNFQDDSSNNDE